MSTFVITRLLELATFAVAGSPKLVSSSSAVTFSRFPNSGIFSASRGDSNKLVEYFGIQRDCKLALEGLDS
jgi:hypothetical protein